MCWSITTTLRPRGKYELRPAVKKLYQLRPMVSASCISCVPRCLPHVYQVRPMVSASRVSGASHGVCFTCISCVPWCLLHVYQLHPMVSASRVSVASHGVCFMRISCVPWCLFHVYQLRPMVSASSVSVASRVNFKQDELRPALSKKLYQLHRKTWAYKMSNKLFLNV